MQGIAPFHMRSDCASKVNFGDRCWGHNLAKMRPAKCQIRSDVRGYLVDTAARLLPDFGEVDVRTNARGGRNWSAGYPMHALRNITMC